MDSRNLNVLHHLDLFECNPKDVTDTTALPDGICDDIISKTRMCSANLATAWAIGADPVRNGRVKNRSALTCLFICSR